MGAWVDHRYHELSDRLFAPVAPTPVAAPELLLLNVPLARRLGLDPDWLASPEGVACLAGNSTLPGTRPVALAYAGHQFGHFSPVLGDGRAILLGELEDADGQRFELQLKGSGPTPFSRRGDGRAALGPALREFIVSEAMAAFGIPTTRALAVISTGELVFRERALPGAIVVRVAASHIRVGTFQFFAARGDRASLQLLADDVIARHYPDLAGSSDRYGDLLDAVAERQARLVAAWMAVGFVHGVMNTDNVALSGETLDYGPCAFLDAYHPATVFSAIDEGGRYAFARQPQMAAFALARLAEAMLPLLADNEDAAFQRAQGAVDGFAARFAAAYRAAIGAKLGLPAATDADVDLSRRLLDLMTASAADFTMTFRDLGDAAGFEGADAPLLARLGGTEAATTWIADWRARLAATPGAGPAETRAAMHAVNPLFIPRNHRLEAAFTAAVDTGSLAEVRDLLTVLADPYAEHPDHAALAVPPEPEERVTRTFCGT
ncbi:protein adenylyltransferase SelO [Methylobrevis albus]|uniref:Protein nucleotidyltransferase YdiU n=1 Tax=Methylobrevis albus TaxID=2793297 RepID=A0A931N0B2_9HYPH|nr:YdiU family protein [Methylobrevis albus]MBH0239875.1 YdiU family protein [Methylobrevis albus]